MLSFLENHDPAKQALRHKMTAERKSIAAARTDAALHAARMFLDHIPLNDQDSVALYSPVRDELDTEPLAAALRDRNVRLALPVVVKKHAPLIFRIWQAGSTLEPGRYKIPVPAPDTLEVIPSHIVVPLLAFSPRGERLGYGGGYYDRTLALLRQTHNIVAIGYGFGGQRVDRLPISKLDQPLDWMITEREALCF